MFRKNKYNDNPPNIHEWKKKRKLFFRTLFGLVAFVFLNIVFYLLTSY